MLHKFFLFSFCTFITLQLLSQKVVTNINTDSSQHSKYIYYKLQLYNGSRRFIDFNSVVQNYTTLYTLYSNYFTSKINQDWNTEKRTKVAIKNTAIQFLPFVFIGVLPHEEGHRSILTHLNIGSISEFTFNLSNGVAMVTGVLDETLKDLRDTRITDYIHLHTAGIETDYSIARKYRKDMFYAPSLEKKVFLDYFLHNTLVWSYLASAFTSELFEDISLSQNSNQRENDIVGHDVYGAIKNFYRPTTQILLGIIIILTLRNKNKILLKELLPFL